MENSVVIAGGGGTRGLNGKGKNTMKNLKQKNNKSQRANVSN